MFFLFQKKNVLLIFELSYGKIFVLQFAKNILHRKSFYPILKILCFACSISRTDNILKILIKRCLKRANCWYKLNDGNYVIYCLSTNNKMGKLKFILSPKNHTNSNHLISKHQYSIQKSNRKIQSYNC